MGPGLGGEVCFDNDDDVEGNREILVEELSLVDAGLEAVFNAGTLQVLFVDVVIIQALSVFAMRATSRIGTLKRQAQGGIPAQLGDQV